MSAFHSADTGKYQSIRGTYNAEYGSYCAARGDIVRVQVNTFNSVIEWKKLGKDKDELICRALFSGKGADIYGVLLSDLQDGIPSVVILSE